jgi:hypothetical protein
MRISAALCALAATSMVAFGGAQSVNCTSNAPLSRGLALTLLNGTSTTLGQLAGRATLVTNTATF